MKKIFICVALIAVAAAVVAFAGCDNINKGTASVTMRTTRQDTTMYPDTTSSMKESAENAKETLKDAAETVKDKVSDAAETLKDGIQNAGRAAESAAENASENLSEAMN